LIANRLNNLLYKKPKRALEKHRQGYFRPVSTIPFTNYWEWSVT
jgi:hypothetical protein